MIILIKKNTGDLMRFSLFILLSLYIGTANATTELSAAIENVRTACGGISAELSDMKKMAGIATAVTGAGTLAGGVALGTGLKKSNIDQEIMALQEELIKKDNLRHLEPITISDKKMQQELNQHQASQTISKSELQEKKSEAEQKSQKLGNIRTGTLATATATNIAGAIMSGNNRVQGDLKQQIDECLLSIKTLTNVRMQARMDGNATDAELARAENIIRACDAWSTVDITPINNRSKGATISSGIGAGLGLAGTITSASANSKDVRVGDNTQKEQNLNTAANVLAGGTTVASATATVFNATQINAIKRAATVAEECEGALK